MRKMIYCLCLIVSMAAAAQAAHELPVTTGLLFHYKADTIIANNGDALSVWHDSAGVKPVAATDLVQVEDCGLPTYIASASNGLPAVRFSWDPGTANSATPLRTSLDSSWGYDDASPLVVFMVCTGGDTGRQQRAFQIGRVGSVSNNGKSLQADVSATQSGYQYTEGYALAASPFAQGQWHISIRDLAANAPGDQLHYSVNGVTELPITSSTTAVIDLFPSLNRTAIGAGTLKDGTWSGYNGDIAEVVVYNRVVSAGEKQQVYDYLFNKYNGVATNPSPAHHAIHQGTLNVDKAMVSFGWNTGCDPNGVVNPVITKHRFYLSTTSDFTAIVNSAVIDATGASASYGPLSLDRDTTYYWRVDEEWPGTEPNTITGWTWTFDTIKALPVIDVQPVNTAVMPGAAATFDISAISFTTTSYTWIKTADEATDTLLDDTEVGYTQVLTLSDIEVADEGYYFCRVTNLDGSVSSNVVMLGVKRQMAHWTLDLSDYVGSQYLDSGANALHIDPNIPPSTDKFVDGANPAYSNQGLDIGTDPWAAGWSANSVWSSAYTDQITISAWIKWNGQLAGYVQQGIVANQASTLDSVTSGNNYYLETHANTDKLWINCNGTTDDFEAASNLPVGTWVHVAVTVGPSGIKFYRNGELDGERTTAAAVTARNVMPMYLGCANRDENGKRYPFNGVLDDVQVFNYEMDRLGVVDLYYQVSNSALCLNPNSEELGFDIAGGGTNGDEPDCAVSIDDFAAFAADWLKCGFYPESFCN